MEFTLKNAVIAMTVCGIASFVLGFASEVQFAAPGSDNLADPAPPTTPPALTKLSDGKFQCIYNGEKPRIIYGSASLVFIIVSAWVGSMHKYHRAGGVTVPLDAYKHHGLLKVFQYWALFMDGIAFYMIFWAIYMMDKWHKVTKYDNEFEKCPVYSGIIGGGALSAFGAALLWMIVFMYTKNCREDYLRGDDGSSNVGSYGLIEEEDLSGW